MSLLHPADETTAFVEATNNLKPRANDAPFLISASTINDHSGRHIHGGHYKEALTPIELPEQGFIYNGKIDRPRLSKKALSKSEIESLARGYGGCSAELRSEVIGAWDFHANITNNIASTHIIDTTSNHLNGFIINLPVRGMTGYNWTADEMVFIISQKNMVLYIFMMMILMMLDGKLTLLLKFLILLKVEFMQQDLRINGEDTPETEDFIPFVIKPPKGKTTSKVLFVFHQIVTWHIQMTI